MLPFLNNAEQRGEVEMQKAGEICMRYGVLTMAYAAADLPPLENLLTPIRQGFDVMAVSDSKLELNLWSLVSNGDFISSWMWRQSRSA